MKNTVKRFFAVFACFVLLALCPMKSLAAPDVEIDPSKPANLTVYYHYDDGGDVINIPGAVFEIYKIADLDEYLNMTFTPDFDDYGFQQGGYTIDAWNDLASTLKGYTQMDSITPTYTRTTNSNGHFTLSGLPVGIYFVTGSKCTYGDYTYTPKPAVVFLPSANPTDDGWLYDVIISPKVSRDIDPDDDPSDRTVTRKVQVVWEDYGNYNKARPTSVVVYLYRDGKLYDSVTLNSNNNWSYVWNGLPAYDENGSKINWTTSERKINDYTTKIQQTGITFTVTNSTTLPAPPPVDPKLPQTGMLWWPVPILLCLGLICVTAGVLRRRSNDE